MAEQVNTITAKPFAVDFKDENLPTFMGQSLKEYEPFIQVLSKEPKLRDMETFMANNQKAINNNVSIDKIPEAKQQYIDDEQLAWDIVGKEKAFEMKQKGSMGMSEAWGKLNKWEILPWLNGVATIDDIKVYKVLNSIKNGEQVSDQDKAMAQEYLTDIAEIQLRGFNFGGNMVYWGARMPAYGIEFATALSTMGSSGVAKASQEVVEAGVKVGIKQLAKEVAVGTGKALVKGGIMTANPMMWHRTVKQYNSDKLNDSIQITDKGQVIFKESTEKPATAWLKAFGKTWIENSSEMAGMYMFKPVTGAIGRTLPKGFGTAWTKAVEKTVGLKYADAIAKFGYDGVLEEMGEERVGDFMRTVLDLDPVKGYSFDQFGAALFPDSDQLLTEFGLISIYGGSSIAMTKLASKLVKPGENPQVILKDLANMSENQKQALLDQVESVEVAQDTAKYTQGIESYGKMLEAIGVQPEVAKANLDILGSFIATTALKTGKSRYELLMELPDIQNMQNVPQGTSKEVQLFQNQIFETENRRKAIELQVKPINEQLDKLEELGKKNTQEYAKLFAEKDSLDSQIKQLLSQESEFQRKIWQQQEIAISKDEQQTLFQNKYVESELDKKAKKYFGLTTNWREAGYITKDGKLLDLSGKNQGAMGGSRSLDHREVQPALDIKIQDFIAEGNIRIDFNSGSIDMIKRPTGLQLDMLIEFLTEKNGKVRIELSSNAANWGYHNSQTEDLYYDKGTDIEDIMRDVESFYNKHGLYQGKTTKTGMFDPRNNIITLLANADRSTFLHESAHFFLQYYLKNIPSELDAVFKFAGVQNKPLNELTAEEYKNLQEHFAYGFEAYVREGKAPNTQLADAFERFKQWLTDIYKNLEELSARAGFKVELSNDIRQFFDEMLSVPENRVATIDENMVFDSDIKLYQDALQKLEEIKNKRTELIKRFGKSARVELQAIDQSIKDLETILNGIKRTSVVRAAEQAFLEDPINQIVVDKIRITPEVKGMMDRYGVPSNVRTTKKSAKTLDEWVTDLGISEEQLLERLAKSGSKREFIDQYIARENAQLEAQGVTPESLKSELQSIGEKLATEYKKTTKIIGQVNEILKEKKAPTAESVYAENLKLGNIENTFMNTVLEKSNDLYKSGSEWLNKTFVPISSGLEKINPKLKQALRKFEFTTLQVKHERNKIVVPFLEKYSKLSVEDARTLDYALKLSDITKINEIIDRNGMRKEYDNVVKMLEAIYDDAVSVGLDVGYLENYFPRKVEDANKFKSYLRGTEQWTRIEEELNRKDPNNEMSYEERAEYISTMLRGMGGDKAILARPGYSKERKIIDLTPEMNTYYKDSSQAIIDYVRAMTEVIEAKKLFGKSEKDIEASIGLVVNDMIANGEIGFADEKRAKELLIARFNARGLNGLWSIYRDFNYLTLLGSPISAITQLEDIGVTMYKSGLFNTMKGLISSITNKPDISLDDLGLETITQEFMDEKTGALAVRKLFKVTGFAFMDKLGKESFVNGVYNKYKELAVKGDKAFTEKLDIIFGEESKQVVKDLKSGVISSNVKYLMFNELAEIQPLTLSEMPEYYVKGGNLRVFYSLKSFTLKRLDYLRRTVIDEISTNPVQGMQNLGRLVFCLMMMGATTDWIKNFLLGRDQDPEEYLVNNIFKLFGFGKWVIYQARREGLMSAFSRQILPPFKLLDDLYKDAVNQRAIEDWDTWSNVPYIGKFYYWWFGRGSSTKNKKSKDKSF